MSHPLSKQTRVFPFASGRTVTTERGEKLFPYDHVLNEQNISNMIKTVLDNQNYLIHFDPNSRSVKFVIGGYYFDTVVPSDIDLVDLWVTVSQFDNDMGYQYLSATDEGASAEVAVFTGVTFSTIEPSDSLGTSLRILDNRSINTAAYLKFDPKSIAGYFDSSVNLSDDLKSIKDSIDAESKTRSAQDNIHTQDITAINTKLTWKPL